MLELEQVSVHYGMHAALHGVSLHVAPAEIVVILGANGAGKSSLLKAIGGMVPVGAGSAIRMEGLPVQGLAAHRIVEQGLALVPEGRGVFVDLSVAENLQLGAFPARARAGEAERLQRVLNVFPKLRERLKQRAGTLSGGEQQMVAIGRGLMGQPRLLVLDEPSLGLAPRLVDEMFDLIRRLNEEGVTILLVEQNVVQSLEIAHRAHVMEHGAIALSGAGAELASDAALAKAYLGM